MNSKDLIKSTKKDGILILSGIMEQYESKVTKKFEEKCELVEKIQENEWITLVLKRK